MSNAKRTHAVATAAVLLCVALSAAGQETSSTMCQAAEVLVDPSFSERRLIGCGEGYSDNLLWHLDRSDSIDGTLDGKVTRRTTGRGSLIYVLDTGVLRAHDEFARPSGTNVIGGFAASTLGSSCDDIVFDPCWFPQNPSTVFVYGHGTGVASVAAGRQTGIAPDASIVSVVFVGATIAEAVAGLKRVIAHAFDPATPQVQTAIINMSIGLIEAPEVTALIERMTTGVDAEGNPDVNGKRFLFVTVAGNYYDDPRINQCDANGHVRGYPAVLAATIDGVVSAGGIDRENRLWSGSCRGALVEVLAPAADMFVASTYGRDTYRYKPAVNASGTSWAAPYVAGMAARLLEADPRLTPAELEALLRNSPSRVDGLPVPVLIENALPSGPRRRAVRH